MDSAPARASIQSSEARLRSLSDEQLIQELGSTRDERCLVILMERYRQQVTMAAGRLLGSDDHKQDVVQLAFVRVFEHASEFQGNSFRAWLFTIARRLCLDRLREKRFEVLPDENIADGEGLSELSRMILEEGLKQLTRPQRLCLRFFYFEGHSYKEIAKITGYADTAVRSHIENGRERLKRFWDRDRPGGNAS